MYENLNDYTIGANSLTGTAVATSSATVEGLTYGGFAGTNPNSVVSIGSAGNERQLQNVAAGQISSTSTDGINGSQLYATQATIGKLAGSTQTIIGGDTKVNVDGSITPPSDLGGTGTTNVNDAVKYLNQGWNYTANGTNPQNVKAGHTVDFKNTDKNIAITDDASGLNFDLSKDINIANSLTVGSVKIDPNGINAGNKVIAGVATGVAGTDAVNVDQLNKTVTDNAYKWSFTGTDKTGTTNSTTVQSGNTVAFKNVDNNLTIQASENDLKIGLADDVKINNSLSVGPVVIDKTAGINAGNLNISNVKAGVAPTDAVNVSQLTKLGNETAGALGGSTKYDPSTGDLTTGLTVNGNTYDTVQKALDNIKPGSWDLTVNNDTTKKQTIDANNPLSINGDQNITVDASKGNVNVTLNDNVNVTLNDNVNVKNSLTVANGVTIDTNGINAANKKITNVAAGDVTDTSLDAVNGSQLKAVKDTAEAGWNYTANGANKQNVKPTNTVDFKNTDKNINITADPTGVTYNLADDVKLNSSLTVGTNTTLDNNGLTIAGGPSVTTVGINAGKKVITNVAAGVENTDAVNVGQLKDVKNVVDMGWNVTGNGAGSQNIQNGSTLDLKNTDGNITIVSDPQSGSVQFGLGDQVKVKDSILVGGNTQLNQTGLTFVNGGPSITTAGVDAGNQKITNVAAGDITDTSLDAVNGSQLKAVKDTAEAGWNYTANGANSQNVKPTNTVDFKNTDQNINITADPTGLTFDLADDVKVKNSLTVGTNTTLDNNGLTIIGGPSVTTAGINAGNKVISNVSAGIDNNDAVNVSQLKEVKDTVNMGWNVTANGKDSQNIKNGSTLDLKNSDGNIAITSDPQTGAIQFDLADQVKVKDSILVGGNTLINQNGLSFVNGGPSITTNGIDAGNKKVTGVANGEISAKSQEAINGSQLKGSLDSIQTILGGNATVNPDGTLNMSNIGGTGYNNINDAIQSVNNTANAGWTLKGKDSTGNDISSQIKPNASVEITNKDSNITVAQSVDANGNAKVEVGLNKDINVDSVTANKVQVGNISIDQNGINAGNTVISNVAAGVKDTDAVNVSQLKDSIANIDGVVKYEKNPDGSYNRNKVNLEGTTAQVDASGKHVTSGGTTIGNVANGQAPADAVNYGQLTQTNEKVVEFLGGGAAYNNITQSFTAPTYNVGGNTYNNVGDALGATNTRIDNLKTDVYNKFDNVNHRIDDLGDELKAGIASSMAIQNAPYVAGKYTYAVGAAHYGGEQAVGVSLRKTADNGRWSINGGVSAATQGDPGITIGLSGVID